MNISKAHFLQKIQPKLVIRFKGEKLTTFSGLYLLEKLFTKLDIYKKLKKTSQEDKNKPALGLDKILLILILHLILGFRSIRDICIYHTDFMARRFLGLKRFPHRSTISRALASLQEKDNANYRSLNKELVLGRLEKLTSASRLTCDFDGTVISTKRYAEGTAIGYNKKHKGERSYYPLLATIAQTGQVLDFLPRAGNVHDSNGAIDFIEQTLSYLKNKLKNQKLETRLDSAFFSEKIVEILDEGQTDFSITVPFERYAELKYLIYGIQRWKRIDQDWSYRELYWLPAKWTSTARFIAYRQKVVKRQKEPVQLQLFTPYEEGYEYKVVVTNISKKAKTVLLFHNGRGYQERIIGELKDQMHLDYIPFKRLNANICFTTCALLSHNLLRELQMQLKPVQHFMNTRRRSPLWKFEEAKTLRQKLLSVAGRLTKPAGRHLLTINENEFVKQNYRAYLESLKKSA